MKKHTNFVPQEREALICTTPTINPTVTKTAADIADEINKSKRVLKAIPTQPIEHQSVRFVPITPRKHKPLKPSGRKREQTQIDAWQDPSNSLQQGVDNLFIAQKESEQNILLPTETFERVKEIAKANPITNEIIEAAKEFTHKNVEVSKKQFKDIVALYNVAHNKAFFYITAAEARLAIDHIKKLREGFVEDMQEQNNQDKIIYTFIDSIPKLNLNKITKTTMKKLVKTLLNHNVDFVETPDSNENGVSNKTVRELTKNLKSPKNECEPQIEAKLKENDQKPGSQFDIIGVKKPFPKNYGLTVEWLNEMFANMEAADLTVDALIMNALRVADIRAWGTSMYNQYSKKEMTKRKVFGRIFTADVYPCNELKENEMVMMSFGNKSFNPLVNPKVLHIVTR